MENIALELIQYVQHSLLLQLRFLDNAIYRLKPKAQPQLSTIFATDGEILWYSPHRVIESFKTDHSKFIRSYLHVMFHCIFHHPFVDRRVNTNVWDVACDIAVEVTIDELNLTILRPENIPPKKKAFNDLQKKVSILTAEKIYRHLLEQDNCQQLLADWKAMITVDHHQLWYENNIAPHQQQWKLVSDRIAVELQTLSLQLGRDKVHLLQNITQVRREKVNYHQFLQKFMTLGEVNELNHDEFDYVYYTYGMEVNENMPLIEPLEYKEARRIKQFVIAIDTSGSVQGELVQQFIQKTYNIFQQSETFFTKFHVRIVQCDTDIKSDVLITSVEEFDLYMKDFKLTGFGGTDFRPVFTYVNQLIDEGSMTDLKGMIYFTDGEGIFPNYKPDYEVAFVFVEQQNKIPSVPVWAIKIVLQPYEL